MRYLSCVCVCVVFEYRLDTVLVWSSIPTLRIEVIIEMVSQHFHIGDFHASAGNPGPFHANPPTKNISQVINMVLTSGLETNHHNLSLLLSKAVADCVVPILCSAPPTDAPRTMHLSARVARRHPSPGASQFC